MGLIFFNVNSDCFEGDFWIYKYQQYFILVALGSNDLERHFYKNLHWIIEGVQVLFCERRLIGVVGVGSNVFGK